MQQVGFDPRSHAGKALMDTLENYPRDELFHTPARRAGPDRRRPSCTPASGASCGSSSAATPTAATSRSSSTCPATATTPPSASGSPQILTDRLGGDSVEFTARVNESTTARVHFVVHPRKGETVPDVDVADLERRLIEASRSWRDDFTAAVIAEYGEERGSRLARRYVDVVPRGLQGGLHPPRTGAVDLGRLEAIEGDEGIDLALLRAGRRRSRRGPAQGVPRRPAALAERGAADALLDGRRGRRRAALPARGPGPGDLHLRVRAALRPPAAGHRPRPVPGRAARGLGRAQRDRRLQRAGARRRADLAAGHRAARLREVHAPGQHPVRARLHRGRAAPATSTSPGCWCSSSRPASTPPAARWPTTRSAPPGWRRSRSGWPAPSTTWPASTTTGSCAPTSPTSARRCAPTTSRPAPTAGCTPTSRFKLEPSAIPELPEPRPKFEIFVYSPRVEGVHLRFGAVARGGLRWSDRRDDFRTEVLGLVKAQMVKNTVIVPVGAKGGFFCKQLPDSGDRDAWMAEGIACYTTFISGLLDITDNLVDGETVPPTEVVRHDGDDSYLVVAADKGTATFSDIANGVAKDYGFWLGDAFASGGSVGYDHKAMGITARGAWVSVQRHFRERGIDCQTEDFTASASATCPATSSATACSAPSTPGWSRPSTTATSSSTPTRTPRRRTPSASGSSSCPGRAGRTTTRDLISEGGGVCSRSLKSIPVHDAVRRALGLADGGHVADAGRADAGDPARAGRPALERRHRHLRQGVGARPTPTPATRPTTPSASTASDLRARCVGEGGNLGLTQLGRIEYARLGVEGEGGRINTDFIDNSAGVDTSDHEVNIKILLDQVVADGDLTEKQRNKLLAEMTDEVAELVLRDNYEQNLALANASAHAPPLLHVHEDWMKQLEQRGVLNRELEALPTSRQVRRRLDRGQGLIGARALGAAGVDQDRARRRAAGLRPARRPLPARGPARLLPGGGCTHDYVGADGGAPAAPADHRDPGGQRPGQRRGHDLLAAAGGRDRRLAGGPDPRQLRGPRDLRLAALRRGDRVVRQRGPGRAPDADADRDAHARRAGVAVAGQQPSTAARHRRRPSTSSASACSP